MATSKKNGLRDYLGLGEGSGKPVQNPVKSALSFAAIASVFNFLVSWLIFRDHFSHAIGQSITFFIGVSLIMWGLLTWQKKKASRLR